MGGQAGYWKATGVTMTEHPTDESNAPVILRLEADPRDANRVVVTYGTAAEDLITARTMLLHIAVVVEEGLYTGQACPAELVARLQAGDEFQREYNRALNFLAVRPRSTAEVRERLRRKNVAPDLIDAVIARLNRARYLDDAEFARYWIGERARSRPRGARLLRGELRNKGVSSTLIEEALTNFEATAAAEHAAQQAAALAAGEMTEPDLVAGDDSRELREALGLAQRKQRSYSSLDPVTFRRRMSGFLLRRGYGYDVVSRVLKQLEATTSGQWSVVSDQDGE
jgi:regulatory protein